MLSNKRFAPTVFFLNPVFFLALALGWGKAWEFFPHPLLTTLGVLAFGAGGLVFVWKNEASNSASRQPGSRLLAALLIVDAALIFGFSDWAMLTAEHRPPFATWIFVMLSGYVPFGTLELWRVKAEGEGAPKSEPMVSYVWIPVGILLVVSDLYLDVPYYQRTPFLFVLIGAWTSFWSLRGFLRRRRNSGQ
ncbi:MAG: hypothetical protein ACE5JX_04475 [Acidobacteriota bacterium]